MITDPALPPGLAHVRLPHIGYRVEWHGAPIGWVLRYGSRWRATDVDGTTIGALLPRRIHATRAVLADYLELHAEALR